MADHRGAAPSSGENNHKNRWILLIVSGGVCLVVLVIGLVILGARSHNDSTFETASQESSAITNRENRDQSAAKARARALTQAKTEASDNALRAFSYTGRISAFTSTRADQLAEAKAKAKANKAAKAEQARKAKAEAERARQAEEQRQAQAAAQQPAQLAAPPAPPVAPAAPPAPPPPATGGPTDPTEAKFFNAINQTRAENGLAPLQWQPALAGSARSWSSTMSRTNLHHDSGYSGFVAQTFPGWQGLAENVGYAGDFNTSYQAFLGSSSHFQNIVGNYNMVGVGVVWEGNTLWVTMRFLRV